MTGRHHLRAFALLVAILCVAHVAPRVFDTGEPARLRGGWIPSDMAYHLVWMLIASAAVFYMCGPVWRADREQLDEREAAEGDA